MHRFHLNWYSTPTAGHWHQDKDLHSNGICIRRTALRQDGKVPATASKNQKRGIGVAFTRRILIGSLDFFSPPVLRQEARRTGC